MPSNEGMRTREDALAREILDDVKDELIDYRSPELAFRQLVTRSLSTSEGGKVVLTVRKQTMTAQELAEGEVPDYQKADFGKIEIDVREYGIHTGVTRIMLEDSRLDEVANATLEARRAMERKLNDLVITELKTGWYDSDETPPDYGSNTFTGSHDHVATTSETELTTAAISEGIHLVNEHGFRADTLVINSAQIEELQNNADVFNGSGVAGPMRDEVMEAGGIGRILGLDVIVNDWIPADSYVVMDRSVRPIAFVERRPLTVEEGPEQFGIVDSFYSWRGGTATIHRGAGAYLTLS